MNTVHIFYNGDDYTVPQPHEDTWNNYDMPNNPRLFLACAASWEKRGWQVIRLRTDNLPLGFEFGNGVLSRDLDKYPITHWNLWHKLKILAPCLCVNMNVFNQSLFPNDPRLREQVDFAKDYGQGLSLHVNGWSASSMFVTAEFVKAVIKGIDDVNEGRLKPPLASVFIDDAIVRVLPTSWRSYPICGFPFIRQDWENFELLHFARSTIRRSMESIISL